MNDFVNNLKREAEANPFVALSVAAGLLLAASKFVNAMAWKQETARRVVKDARK